MLRLWIYGTVFGLRLIVYLIPGSIGVAVIGLMIFWPHMAGWMQSVVTWCIIHMVVAFVCAIPFGLLLDVPIAAGTIGCLVIVLCGEAAPIVGKVWRAITHAVTAAVDGIPTHHWVIAGLVIVGSIIVECWKAWRRAYPPLADDDDDFEDEPTASRLSLRLAPPRLSRAERKQAAIYAEIERKSKLCAAWEAWYSNRGPRPF
jgi:hypothetical protein